MGFFDRFAAAKKIAVCALLPVSSIIAAAGVYGRWPDIRSGGPAFVMNLKSAIKAM